MKSPTVFALLISSSDTTLKADASSESVSVFLLFEVPEDLLVTFEEASFFVSYLFEQAASETRVKSAAVDKIIFFIKWSPLILIFIIATRNTLTVKLIASSY